MHLHNTTSKGGGAKMSRDILQGVKSAIRGRGTGTGTGGWYVTCTCVTLTVNRYAHLYLRLPVSKGVGLVPTCIHIRCGRLDPSNHM